MKNTQYIIMALVAIIAVGFIMPSVARAQDLDLEGIELPSIPALEKPISQMTIPEIKAKITEIMEVIKQLQTILAKLQLGISGIPGGYAFNTNLKYGQSNNEVKYLQIILNQDPETRVSTTGYGSPAQETTYFGTKTLQAVIKFQEKYQTSILSPYNLAQGTGYVGSTTRAKLNDILEQYREEPSYTPDGAPAGEEEEEEEPLGYCGDKIIQKPNSEGIYEVCDTSNLGNNTCQTRGYARGTLSCSSNCITFNTINCIRAAGGGGGGAPSPEPSPEPEPQPICGDNTDNICPDGCTHSQDDDCTYCGDNILQRPNDEGILETCDTNQLNNQTCITKGFPGGTLRCSNTCLTFDTSQCTPPPPPNQAPTLNSIGNKSIDENQQLSFTISATDPDGDTLTYSVSNRPSGATFNATTRTFTWTPSYAQSGTYNLTFTVSDGSLTDTEIITITVYNINRAPVLAAIGNKSVDENQTLTFTISGTDPDGDTLTYSIQNRPSGATFNSSTRTFSWTPSYTQSGNYNVTFIVSDGEYTDTETITITVNDVPTCTPTTCQALGYNCGTHSDGCGATLNCGTCSTGYTCSSGQCVAVCVPDCAGKECGDDGCGASCGSCGSGYYCSSGSCVMLTANIIFVDGSLTADCSETYSIANRDCSGSDGDAYDKPQEATDVVNPGDTIYFREGIYYRHDSTSAFAVVMNILRSGTPDNPITFKNYNNEEAIFSGMHPEAYHYHTLTLGIEPSGSKDISGAGVHDIIIDGLIVEGARRAGLVIFGPANRYASAENPTENVIIRNVIARHNGGGIGTKGKLVNVLIENCEAYNNTGSGITFGRVDRDWHLSEPEDDMSAAQHSVIRNCLAYNNIIPDAPGNSDGIVGSHMYRCTFEDNIAFGNDDDGMDIYASIESTAKNNILFNHNYPGGNGCGMKCSSGGGGRHTIAGNIALNNKGPSFEGSDPGAWYRIYYPSRIYSNLAYNGHYGFSLGDSYNLTYPGFEKVFLRDNLVLDNIWLDFHHVSAACTDSDYNFISKSDDFNKMQDMGLDLNSLTGEAGIVNKNVVIDTNFGADWTIEQKLEHIRSQVRTAFGLTSTSQLIDAGVLVPNYHCPAAGQTGDCMTWYGNAPDIGAYEYQGGAPSTCLGTDTSCGSWPNCTNCNSSDGCSGTTYRDYYCSGTSCVYTEYPNDSRCVECTSGQTRSCNTGLLGICASGTQTCQSNGTWGTCIQDNQPSTEVCNDSLDNDCDGTTDCSDTDCSSDPACQAPPSVIPSDYISWWKFDGNANDETGINNGTIYGNPQFVPGVQGQALDFDGTGDYVNCGDINGDEGVPSLTISFWAKVNSLTTAQFFASRRYDSPYLWQIYHTTTNDVIFYVYTTSGNNYGKITTAFADTVNWYHIVGVYNGAKVLVYVNGVLGATQGALTGNTNTGITGPLIIAGRGLGDTLLAGKMDNFMVFNRALSASEIQAIYDAQKPAGTAMMDETKLKGLASILEAIREILEKIKNLF